MTEKEMNNNETQKKYWRSLQDEAQTPEFLEKMKDEFPQGLRELDHVPPVDRRKFLGIMGSSMALAGVTSLSGCIRKPRELVLPYNQRPEDMIPGKSMYFATSSLIGGEVLGLVVESHEGRPTKVEGNAMHSSSMGSASLWAQASVLDMYDTDRSRAALNGSATVSQEKARAFLTSQFHASRQEQGQGVALLVDASPSPTFHHMLEEFKAAFPKSRLFVHDASFSEEKNAALAMVGRGKSQPVYALELANVVLAADADFLGKEGNSVRNSRAFANRRRVATEESAMNRLYAMEPAFTVTGMHADNRLRVNASMTGEFLLSLAAALNTAGVRFPPEVLARANTASNLTAQNSKWITAVANDLAKNRGKAVVIAGEHQPAWVQGLAFAINDALGSVGTVVQFFADISQPDAGSISDLTKLMSTAGEVKTLVIIGGNPAYDAPADLRFADLLKNVATSIHLSEFVDETSKLCTWHLPRSHYLETWSDARASDGTVGIQQPLIAPLFESFSEIELMSAMLETSGVSGYETIRNYWKTQKVASVDFEKSWRRWLHDGVVGEVRGQTVVGNLNLDSLLKSIKGSTAPAAVSASNIEIVFPLDHCVYDGRFANNGWLQELPDPATKITWDNAALICPQMARDLNLAQNDVVQIQFEGRSLEAPVFVQPGVADHTIMLARGYGRTFGGAVATGAGVNANLLRSAQSSYFGTGATLTKVAGKTYKLATTQEHSSMEGRPIVRENTLAGFKSNPEFAEKMEILPREEQQTLLWKKPNIETGHQWGMSIDLNVCTGCSACTIACNAENNIPVVGKGQILNNRELHWIRIDRYFEGSVDDPQAVFQPMACQQCENAPCESVCPVGATVHSPEGLNEMTYNRCIGTRYCLNNCPYKVRRFNFFNYSKRDDEANPLHGMQKNPNVTVRFRGVMEKCTYCVQRINEARIESKVKGSDLIADGRITPACAQTCPTKAITFGDINNPDSEVSRVKRQKRNYVVLGELNTQPRTSYLAKLRNPNPELV